MENTYTNDFNVEMIKMVLTPRDLIKLHIKDRSHVVTDDDLRRLTVGAEVTSFSLVKSSNTEKLG